MARTTTERKRLVWSVLMQVPMVGMLPRRHALIPFANSIGETTMAHLIEQMAYVGQTPLHGLGNGIDLESTTGGPGKAGGSGLADPGKPRPLRD
ncbi:MAG: hypothetical protein KTR18_09045 [Acidiferrobacterales bacterium]|nr:hypothetical protein [Acidiferrobacterales bacterium]